MARTVVFVAGLYHSGSTLLDLLLGRHPQIVGLGEIHFLLTLQPEPMCSCGAAVERCAFWGDTLKTLEGIPKADVRRRLDVVLRRFAECYDRDRILVDSSKKLEALRLMAEMPDVDLRVVHLVRDVRSWTMSLLERDRRDNFGGGSALSRRVRRVTRGATARFMQWYVENRRIEAFLAASRVPSLRIGYEELALNPRVILPKVCEFVGIDHREDMYVPDASHSHVAVGNPFRHRRSRVKAITYDARWLTSSQWVLPSLVLRHPVMVHNQMLVYSNTQPVARA